MKGENYSLICDLCNTKIAIDLVSCFFIWWKVNFLTGVLQKYRRIIITRNGLWNLTVQQLPGRVYPCIHCIIGESAIRGQPWVPCLSKSTHQNKCLRSSGDWRGFWMVYVKTYFNSLRHSKTFQYVFFHSARGGEGGGRGEEREVPSILRNIAVSEAVSSLK